MTKKQQREQAKRHIYALWDWVKWYKSMGENDKMADVEKHLSNYRCFVIEMEIANKREIDKWEINL